ATRRLPPFSWGGHRGRPRPTRSANPVSPARRELVLLFADLAAVLTDQLDRGHILLGHGQCSLGQLDEPLPRDPLEHQMSIVTVATDGEMNVRSTVTGLELAGQLARIRNGQPHGHLRWVAHARPSVVANAVKYMLIHFLIALGQSRFVTFAPIV